MKKKKKKASIKIKKRGMKMSMKCYVFICEFDNDYDGCTIVANSKDSAIKLLSQRIEWNDTEWNIHEIEIPSEGIIIENSIPEEKYD
jgi:hypothetical protein